MRHYRPSQCLGKSTIFNRSQLAKAQVANYPFCTIQPNQGIVPVPDERLEKLAQIPETRKSNPHDSRILGYRGLVKGASKGKAWEINSWGHIRNVDALAHVIRCFEAESVTHVYATLTPRGISRSSRPNSSCRPPDRGEASQ